MHPSPKEERKTVLELHVGQSASLLSIMRKIIEQVLLEVVYVNGKEKMASVN